MLEAIALTKRYGDEAALDTVSLTVPAGRTSVLIGPSGCGKSTLLRAMIGLVKLDEGTVLFQGEALTARNLLQIRRNTGYVIQTGGLFPHLNARRNLALAAGRMDTDVLTLRISELCKLVRLEESLLERYPSELSGGQRQRVSLARALVQDPAVLLLDEPLGALDPMVRAELQRDLREIFRKLGKTVLMVTHDLAEAAYFGDFVVLMRDGRIEQRGAYNELLEAPETDFVRQFVNAQRELHSTEQAS